MQRVRINIDRNQLKIVKNYSHVNFCHSVSSINFNELLYSAILMYRPLLLAKIVFQNRIHGRPNSQLYGLRCIYAIVKHSLEDCHHSIMSLSNNFKLKHKLLIRIKEESYKK